MDVLSSNMNQPSVLYKYIRRIHAEQMIKDGEVRIGTIEDFKKEDKYCLEIGDKNEGTQKTHMRGKTIDLTRPETIPSAIRRAQLEKKLIGKGFLTIHNHINESVQNSYVYCLSPSNKLLKRYYEVTNGDYNSIVEVSNPMGFVEALTVCVNQNNPLANTCSFRLVDYVSREQEFEKQTETHPIFVKEPRHKWQEEYRLVWGVEGKEINPLIIRCPQIKEYIKIIGNPGG